MRKKIIRGMSIIVPVLALLVLAGAAAASAVFPSTNDLNRTNEWAHVDQLSASIGSTDLQFISTKSFASCFEYRTDGDTNQVLRKNGGNNYNTLITDGLYPYVCGNNSTATLTISANQYVEVRSAFGAETDERFDWTRFEVLPAPTPQFTVTIVKYLTGPPAAKATAGPGFPMGSTWTAANLNSGVTTSGTYSLAPPSFSATTSLMDRGSSYTTNEVTGGVFLSIGSTCVAGKYVLQGYRIGDSEAAAAASHFISGDPTFASLTSNQWVIVENLKCPDAQVPPPAPTDKQQCKKGGWETLFRADGTTFKNQGDCVSFTNNGK